MAIISFTHLFEGRGTSGKSVGMMFYKIEDIDGGFFEIF